MNYPALLSFACGFASLSLEILWVRLYSFAKLSTPAAFGSAHWPTFGCKVQCWTCC